ncbi:MAG: DUF1295 domain-containing protein [Promethearchaeota archaeon]
MSKFVKSRSFGYGLVSIVYITALILSYWLYFWIDTLAPVWELLIIDIAATLWIYLWSCVFRNASLYDPYWSIAPLFLGLFWLDQSFSYIGDVPVKLWIIYGIVALWAIRLTYNWSAYYRGLTYEDFRYRFFREKTGKWFFLVNLFGIQVMPTILVFFGSLSMSYSLTSLNSAQFTIFDIIGLIIAGGAIAIETISDYQMHKFVKKRTDRNQIMDQGLWSRSRHPNYFGEVAFWWGLFCFALGADYSSWWTIAGPIGMVVLFLTYSIPAMDKHQLTRKEAYKKYMEKTPAFIPRIFQRNK